MITKLLLDMCVENVSELQALLSVVTPEIRVTGAGGALLKIRVYENDNERYMEVA
jgi:hypothetical protein